jgi:hypothetical protein
MALPKKHPKRITPHKPTATLTNSQTIAERTQTQPAPVQYEPQTVEGINVLMNHLTKAISHLSFHEICRLHLLDLPQEIQNIIFDFAYPCIDGYKLITKTEWNRRKWGRRRDRGYSYIRQPFCAPKFFVLNLKKGLHLSRKSFCKQSDYRSSLCSVIAGLPELSASWEIYTKSTWAPGRFHVSRTTRSRGL